MKKIFTLAAFALFALASCSNDGPRGPQGPQGPPGPPGEDGLDGLGYTFEETFTFDYFPDSNLYSRFITISEDIVTVNPEADAVLVYRLEIVEANDGSDLDTWSLIPQNFFLEQGTMQYVYNHTANDVEVIIDGNFDLSTLDARFTDDQTFRVVIVPSDYAQTSGVDISDLEAVMNDLSIQEADVKEIGTW